MAKKSGTKPANMTPESSASNIEGDYQLRGQMRVDPSLKDKGVEGVLQSAGLLFEPMIVTNTYTVNGKTLESKFNRSTVRSDTGSELGGVGMRYNPVSHMDAFKALFTEALSLDAMPTRALSFDNGAIGVIQFKMPGEGKAGGQTIQNWLSLINALDGRHPIRAGQSGVTVVCGNTCWLASQDLALSAKHTRNVGLKLRQLRDVLTSINVEFKNYVDRLETWSTVKVSLEDKKKFVETLFPAGKETNGGEIRANVIRKRELLETAIKTEAEVYGPDLAINLFQGVTRLVDWHLAPHKAKNTTETDSDGNTIIKAQPKIRSESEQYEYVMGQGQELKDNALAIMRELFK